MAWAGEGSVDHIRETVLSYENFTNAMLFIIYMIAISNLFFWSI